MFDIDAYLGGGGLLGSKHQCHSEPKCKCGSSMSILQCVLDGHGSQRLSFTAAEVTRLLNGSSEDHRPTIKSAGTLTRASYFTGNLN